MHRKVDFRFRGQLESVRIDLEVLVTEPFNGVADCAIGGILETDFFGHALVETAFEEDRFSGQEVGQDFEEMDREQQEVHRVGGGVFFL